MLLEVSTDLYQETPEGALRDRAAWRLFFAPILGLITAIGDYVDHHNANPKPFIGTAKASDIWERVTRAHAAFINDHLSGGLHQILKTGTRHGAYRIIDCLGATQPSPCSSLRY